jgi:hypothetical protein
MDHVAEIRRIYLRASHATIGRDLARAIELLGRIATEEERQRAAVYMDGLSQMRSEWKAAQATRRPTRSTR